MRAANDGIVTLFREQLNVEITNPDADLIDDGLMDSLMLVDLLAYLEKEYQITIGLDDLEVDNFRTVTSIVQFIEAKRLDQRDVAGKALPRRDLVSLD